MTYEFRMKPGAGEAPKPMASKAKEDACRLRVLIGIRN